MFEYKKGVNYLREIDDKMLSMRQRAIKVANQYLWEIFYDFGFINFRQSIFLFLVKRKLKNLWTFHSNWNSRWIIRKRQISFKEAFVLFWILSIRYFFYLLIQAISKLMDSSLILLNPAPFCEYGTCIQLNYGPIAQLVTFDCCAEQIVQWNN